MEDCVGQKVDVVQIFQVFLWAYLVDKNRILCKIDFM